MTRLRGSLLIWCSSLLAAAIALHPILASSGIPAYHHDWVWPFDALQLRDAVRMNVGVWQPVGLGSPNVAPVNHPLFWLWFAASFVVGTPWILKATLLGLFTAYAAGVGFCVRRAACSDAIVCALCGMIALLAPPVFDKFLAGHVNYLIALSSCAWTVYFSLGAGQRDRDLLAAGALAALCAIQIQLFALAEASVIAAIVVAAGRRGATLPAVCAFLLSLVLICAELWSLHAGSVLSFYESMQTLTHWEVINSAPFPDAIVGFGYFTHYAENTYSAFPYGTMIKQILWIFPLAALAGVIRARSPLAFGFAAVWLILQSLVIGLHGPLAVPLTIAFRSGLAFSILRELYHFEAPAWMMVCLLAAMGLRGLPYGATYVLATAVAAAAAVAWMPAGYGGQLYSFTASPGTLDSVSRISSDLNPWAVLMLPSQTPIGQSSTSGADPYAYPIGVHPLLNGYRITGLAQAAAGFGDADSNQAWDFRHLVGVGALVMRPELHSNLAGRFEKPRVEPQWFVALLHERGGVSPMRRGVLRAGTCLLCAYDSLPVVRAADDWHDGKGFVVARDVLAPVPTDPDLVPRRLVVIPQADTENADPSLGWVRKDQWDFLDRRIAQMPAGVLTWSSKPLTVPAGPGHIFARVLVLHGFVTAGNSRLPVQRGGPQWIEIPRSAQTLRVHNGLMAVESFVRIPRYAPAFVSRGRSPGFEGPLSFNWQTASGGGTVPVATRWIVLKQHFSTAFELHVQGGRIVRHIPVDGFANGWEIQGRGPMRASLTYRNSEIITFLEWSGLAVWLLSVCLLLFPYPWRKVASETV